MREEGFGVYVYDAGVEVGGREIEWEVDRW